MTYEESKRITKHRTVISSINRPSDLDSILKDITAPVKYIKASKKQTVKRGNIKAIVSGNKSLDKFKTWATEQKNKGIKEDVLVEKVKEKLNSCGKSNCCEACANAIHECYASGIEGAEVNWDVDSLNNRSAFNTLSDFMKENHITLYTNEGNLPTSLLISIYNKSEMDLIDSKRKSNVLDWLNKHVKQFNTVWEFTGWTNYGFTLVCKIEGSYWTNKAINESGAHAEKCMEDIKSLIKAREIIRNYTLKTDDKTKSNSTQQAPKLKKDYGFIYK